MIPIRKLSLLPLLFALLVGIVPAAFGQPAALGYVQTQSPGNCPAGQTCTAPVGPTNPMPTGGTYSYPSASFVRPADSTAYASGDLVANSTVAGSVVPMSFTAARVNGGSGMIRRFEIQTSSTSVTNASFRLHLYTVSPTPSNGDNGAWLTNGVANYLGSLDVTLDKAFTDGASGVGLPTIGNEVNFSVASGTRVLFGLLEARAAYTPSSGEVFTVNLEVLQN